MIPYEGVVLTAEVLESQLPYDWKVLQEAAG
jgi:hypothetical protein